MDEWIPLDMLELTYPREMRGERHERSVVHVVMSPHDVPIAVRGRKDQDDDRFVIEFKYLDQEPTKKIKLPDGAQAEVGKHSERLYGFSFPHSVGSVVVQIEATFDKGLKQLMQSPAIEKSQLTDRNFGAARQAVDSKREQIVTA